MVGVSAVRLKLPLKDGDGLSCARTPARAEGDTWSPILGAVG